MPLEKGHIATMYHAGSSSYARAQVLEPMSAADVEAETLAAQDDIVGARAVLADAQQHRDALQQALDRAVQDFDADTVHRVMTTLNWKWADYMRVPTAQEIRANADRLGHSAINWIMDGQKRASVSSGGIEVEICMTDAGTYVNVQFVAVSMSASVRN